MSIQYDTRAATAHVAMRALQLSGYIGARALAPLIALWRKLGDGARRRRRERELDMLSDDVLKDIGVGRSEILWLARGGAAPFRRSHGRQE
jgi:uncharacterized protein YjiS (DUF1127 family)